MRTKAEVDAYLKKMDMHRYRHQLAGMTLGDFQRLENRYRQLWRHTTKVRKRKHFQERWTYWSAVRFLTTYYEKSGP
jgi:hypothetical protein